MLRAKDSIYACGLGVINYYKPERFPIKNVISFLRLKSSPIEGGVKDVACGYGFTVFVTKDQTSTNNCFGFGFNSHSQIGYHELSPGRPLEIVIKPQPIFTHGKPIAKVKCGRAHSVLLDESGSIFTLGNNAFGQCCRPINPKEEYFGRDLITKVKDLPDNIIGIECGQDHSMFLTAEGKVYSCGWGADGQTGLGHNKNQANLGKVKGDIKNVKIIKLSSRCDTVLALDDQNNVFGWGNSEYAQFRNLTYGDSEQFNTPRLLKINDVPGRIVDIACGGTICALLNDKGHVYVWGFGILGLGPKIDHLTYPTLIPPTLFGINDMNEEEKVVSIDVGHSHFSAITSSGDLYNWGRNRSGCLGFGHNQDQYFPMKVNLDLGIVRKVALGIDHSCAIVGRVC